MVPDRSSKKLRGIERLVSNVPEGYLFDVYGFRFHLRKTAPTPALDSLASDFHFFRSEAAEPDSKPIDVTLHVCEPPYSDVPQRAATIYTPRNIAFSEGSRTYIDYGTRALAIYDRAASSFHIYSQNDDLLHEATYLFLLSRIGEFLDSRRLHRIHAMALGFHGRAVLAILPMGGGKSTLCAELLKDPELDFLSDDSPFIDRHGAVRAFPLRLGLLPGGEKDIPAEHVRTIQRMEFGPKILVNYDYFGHRVKPAAEPGIVLLGYRSLSPHCRIEPAGKMESYRSMIADCAVGLGLFQGLEFMLRSSPTELIDKAGTIFSRFRNARTLFQRSHVYRLILGRDREENARAVGELIRRKLGAPAGRRG
jgi:hypothetical protein